MKRRRPPGGDASGTFHSYVRVFGFAGITSDGLAFGVALHDLASAGAVKLRHSIAFHYSQRVPVVMGYEPIHRAGP
jgi:hypothetical protein